MRVHSQVDRAWHSSACQKTEAAILQLRETKGQMGKAPIIFVLSLGTNI